ncbi:MAG TPA: diacylglycerol kinase family protein [Candidatus Acidoferrum sp.]|nr:diacylglycerol kinase family protein [Candidatus Acidoferrum sp.]
MASSALTCILNSTSGSHPGPELREKLSRIFAENGTPARILLASSGAEIPELARRAVKENSQIIVAGGGDGTVNAVANELMGSSITLGVLPLGTLNHFAKDLYIPQDIEGAARNLFTGRAVPVDVGEVNGRIFLNNSSLGIYPRIVRHCEEQQKKNGRNKWVAFAQASLSVLRHYSLLRVRLLLDGKELLRKTPLVFIGNNKYEMEGLNFGERRRIDAGELCLFVANRAGRVDLVRLAFLALFGRLHEASDFDALITKQFSIETRRPRTSVSTDGEVNQMNTPLNYLTHPGALRVIVPVKNVPGGSA